MKQEIQLWLKEAAGMAVLAAGAVALFILI
jgi:hypothetical protein